MKPPNRKKMSKNSPQHLEAVRRREIAGGRPQQTPKVINPRRLPRDISPEDAAWLRSAIIHEDDEIIAFNKPAGLSSQGGRGGGNNLDDMLWSMAKSNGKRPSLIHRLDRDTSGVIVAAKTKPALSFLGKAIAARRVHKTYLCLITNPSALEAKGVIDVALRREEIGREAYSRVCEADHPDALVARTDYEVIARNELAALVRCYPVTGRMHQIRVHLAYLGAPIAGDVRYGGALMIGTQPAQRLMLHAAGLDLPRMDGGVTHIDCPLEDRMQKAVNSLGF